MYRGNFSWLAGHWTGFLQSLYLLGDGDGNVWVMGLGGDIYRVSIRLGDKSPVEFAETISESDYYLVTRKVMTCRTRGEGRV